MLLETERLELVAVGVELARLIAAGDGERLGELLGARVPNEWPPELMIDLLPQLVEFTEDNGGADGWAIWLMITRAERTLVGATGFKGRPDGEGRVDTGYSVLPSWQGRGYATEAVRALVEWAWRDERVTRIVGETFPQLKASIRVLEKCGLQFMGIGVGHEGEPEVLQYEVRRGGTGA